MIIELFTFATKSPDAQQEKMWVLLELEFLPSTISPEYALLGALLVGISALLNLFSALLSDYLFQAAPGHLKKEIGCSYKEHRGNPGTKLLKSELIYKIARW